MNHSAVQKSPRIALYYPIRNEVDTLGLLPGLWLRGQATCFPRVCGSNLEFIEVSDRNGDNFEQGAFGVPEPKGVVILNTHDIDCFLVPGVAFDRHGYRLGYGRGYYDRALGAPRKGSTIGLAFDFQIVDVLPRGKADIPVDLIVTPTRVLRP